MNSHSQFSRAFALSLFFIMAVGHSSLSQATESGFVPAGDSPFGPVSEVRFRTDYTELGGGVLTFHRPGKPIKLSFDEPIWIIGYETEIFTEDGQRPGGNYICHTFLADREVGQHQKQALRGVYSDHYNPKIRFPEGLGIRISAGETLTLMEMFNNRGEEAAVVGMHYTLTVIRESDLTQPLRPLYSMMRSVAMPHLYFVPPGRHSRNEMIDFEVSGHIHFMGPHIHPYGESVELYNVTRDELIWKGSTEAGPDGKLFGTETFSSAEGYAVNAGDQYRLTVTYNNTTDKNIDAMGGLFIFYAPKSG